MEQRTVVNTIPVTVDKFVESVHEFNRIAGRTPPGHFNAERVGFYIGMQLEELAETLEAVAEGAVQESHRRGLLNLIEYMQSAGVAFKEGTFQGDVMRADREKLLDGGIDSMVVSTGMVVYQTPHFRQGIEHVLVKNAEKVPNGIAQRDANGKIQKPEGWTPPDLTPFIDRTGINY